MNQYSYNRIIIIGNGYDRALNLPTSYNHFLLDYLRDAVIQSMYRPYINDPLFNIEHTPYRNREDVKGQYEKYTDFNIFYENACRHFVFVNKSEFFELLIEHVTEKNWVDIENLYFNLLVKLLLSIQKKDPLNRNFESITKLNQQLDFLKEKLEHYLFNKVQKNHFISPLESPMQALHIQFNEKLNGTSAFKLHNRLDTEIPNPEKVLFLNFNYTKYLKQIIYSKWHNNYVIDIHGELNNSKNQIIFGYGDDTHPMYESLENEQSDEPLKQIKSFYYSKTANYHSMLGFLNDKPFEVFIVGHSCGLSDRTLLKSIFEHGKCLGIKIYHRGSEQDFFLKNMAISRHFSDKLNLRDKILPYDENATIPQSILQL